MWPFKKNVQEPIQPLPCNHKWKDFNWYLEYSYDSSHYLDYKIIEPYVCTICHERKNVVLSHHHLDLSSRREIKDKLSKLYATFPKLRHEEEVEDEINDFIMVDRQYLTILETLSNPDTDAVPKLKI